VDETPNPKSADSRAVAKTSKRAPIRPRTAVALILAAILILLLSLPAIPSLVVALIGFTPPAALSDPFRPPTSSRPALSDALRMSSDIASRVEATNRRLEEQRNHFRGLFGDRALFGDPALAELWARDRVFPQETFRIRQELAALRAAASTTQPIEPSSLGPSSLVIGNPTPQLSTQHSAVSIGRIASAIRLLTAYATTHPPHAEMLLFAAEELPPLYEQLAARAEADGNPTRARALHNAATQWKDFYAAFRDARHGPENLFPMTGAGAFDVKAHTRLARKFAQTGLALVGLIVYATMVILVAGRALLARFLGRHAEPVRWARTSRFQAYRTAVILVHITFFAWGATWFVGDDWTWLLSARVVISAAILLLVAHTWMIVAMPRLRFAPVTTPPSYRPPSRRRYLFVGIALTVAVVIALLIYQPDEARRPFIPPSIDRLVFLARAWLFIAIVWALIGLIQRARHWLRGRPFPDALLGPRWRHALLYIAALGLLEHAVFFTLRVRSFHHAHTAYSEHFDAALRNEPAERLGPDWRTRIPTDVDALIGPALERADEIQALP
jgi:hypothetical protein